ncbi:MAG: TAT-variant-translocated molybdopterin oxidoreductase [Vicingaceae bacterium]
MGSANKKYWKGIEELTEEPSFIEQSNKEFVDYVPVDNFMSEENALSTSNTSRRDFLKFLGFSVTAATIASCETPVTKAIPYLVKPEELNPGVANYYSSTYFDGNDFSNILIKTREGRPIHIEANKNLSGAGVNARVNSSVLMLYDSNRLQYPVDKSGEEVSWKDADKEIISALKAASAKGGKIRVLTNTIVSPSTQSIIDNFAGIYGGEGAADVRHISYDSISYSGMIAANSESFGKAFVPSYRFDKAGSIVSIGADFLSTWLSSVEYAGQYGKTRKPDGEMSKHFQFEAGLSVTGSNADHRTAVLPSEYGKVAVDLYNAVAELTGGTRTSGGGSPYTEAIQHAAESLVSMKGKSLVVCGSNDKSVQIVVNAINAALGNYGSTIDLNHPSHLRRGSDTDLKMLTDEMNKGQVDVLITFYGNPAWTSPSSLGFASGMEKVGMKVSMATYFDETSQLCDYTLPDNHFLEAWGDANPTQGVYALAQPTISPLYNSRQVQESLLTWMGQPQTSYDYIRAYWENNLFPTSGAVFFEDFWNQSLHDGIYTVSHDEQHEEPNFAADVSAAASAASSSKSSELELFLYQKTGIGDGQHASNPWLQELPDPVSKITWDNYVTMAASDMKARGFNLNLGQEQESDMVTVTVGDLVSEELPVVAQPGQKPGTIGIALGYGRQVWKNKEKIGVNAYPFSEMNGTVSYHRNGASITETGNKYHVAATQTSHTVMGRTGVIRETTLDVYKAGDRNDFNPVVALPTHEGLEAVKNITLWEPQNTEISGHLWGMSIDLNTCIGCGSCVTACNSENNVPVVGKDEVRRGREMHWMRIDRYYSSDADLEDKSISGYRSMEEPGSMPEVVYQPMMCQHCNNAPCETVCPVAATTHSNEGLNQMTYNRCIGTRYCANNCPYKVRRFNWFNYIADRKFTEFNPSQDDLGRMVLNPDVTVRARGVMEKCSMCVQRIQAGKLEAKKNSSKVEDEAISTACASACPTHAITFGDLNDKSSRIANHDAGDRAYRVIEDVGTRPNIVYLTKVRNKETAQA